MQSPPNMNSHLKIFSPPQDGNAGFHLSFKNGYTVSVMFGRMAYCSHRMKNANEIRDPTASPDAEVAIFAPNGDMIRFNSTSEEVKGHCDPDEIAKIITWASSQTNGDTNNV